MASETVSVVVPAISVTMLRSWFRRALKIELLPTLGLPRTATLIPFAIMRPWAAVSVRVLICVRSLLIGAWIGGVAASSGWSRLASIWAVISTKDFSKALSWSVIPRVAYLRWASLSAPMISMIASAWSSEILPFMNARRENSPRVAWVAPCLIAVSTTLFNKSQPPWHWNSTISSPVKLLGDLK